MLEDLLVPTVAVGLAEIGDKTQLALMSLAAKTRHHSKLLIGAMLGFAITDGIAILLGSSISALLPLRIVRLFAGLLFLLFGILTLREREEHGKSVMVRTPLLSSFTLVLISEWGDKSQIAAGLFAATYNPWLVFLGVVAVLSAFTLLSLFLGKFMAQHVHPRWVRLAAGLTFLIIGIATLAQINKL